MIISMVSNENVVGGRIVYEGASRNDSHKETVFFTLPKESLCFGEGDEFLVSDSLRDGVIRYKCIGVVQNGSDVNISGRI